MAEVRLRWAVAGDVQLDRQFNRLAIEVQDFTEPLSDVADLIYADTEGNFAAEGRPAWPPLSEAYAARKARRYPGKPIMVATDALHASLTDRNAPDAVFELTPVQLTIGTDVKVGEKWNLGLIHQKPVTAPVPARPMLWLQEPTKRASVKAFRTWFRAEAARQGLEA